MAKKETPVEIKSEWTPDDLKRIMSAEAKKYGGKIPKDSWVTDVQRLVDKRKVGAE